MIIDGKRALAYTAKITDIKPIEGADKIELAQVNNGWWSIVSKSDYFHIGDTCIFLEIDSKVPEKDKRFEFLKDKKYRVKTMKMRGVVSQGLIMPLVPFDMKYDTKPGIDLTDRLHITNYTVKMTEEEELAAEIRRSKIMSMRSRHKELAKKKWWKWLMKREWGINLLLLLLGKKKEKPGNFPNKFHYVKRTDEERCLYKNEKIMTDRGLIRIIDIVNKQLDVNVLTYNEQLNILEYKPILEYQKFPAEKELIEIRFPYRYGVNKLNTLTCTKDHRIFTDRGYVRAEDLTLEDKVYLAVETFDDEIVEYLYGHILGDGHLIFDGDHKYGFSFCQGQAHKIYFDTLRKAYNGSAEREERSGFKPENKVYKFGMHHLDILSYCLNNDGCIKDKKFTVTKEFCDRLTEKSIAVWYMDDGSCSFSEDGRFRTYAGFSTAAFSREECELLADCLRTKFGIEGKVKGKKYMSIDLDRPNSRKLFELIGKYFTEDLQYKLPPDMRGQKSLLDNVEFKPKYRLLPEKIKSIKTIPFNKSGKCFVYDLKVADNHNFFARGILNHNCENMTWVLENKEPFTVTEKLDGSSSTYILERKHNKFNFYVCSRNIRQYTPDQECFHGYNIYWDMAIKYDIENKLKAYLEQHPRLKYVCIQGESVGHVQGNPLDLEEDDLYVFNFIRSDLGRLSSTVGKEIIESWGMKWVPILDTTYILPDTLEELKEYTHGYSVVNPKVLREGIVCRQDDISFKSVDIEFLLWKEQFYDIEEQ